MGVLEYHLILSVFLGISWFVRYIVSQGVSRRVSRKVAGDAARFCAPSSGELQE